MGREEALQLRRPGLLRRQVRRTRARGRGARLLQGVLRRDPRAPDRRHRASSCSPAEQGISAGTRRVEALTGAAAMERPGPTRACSRSSSRRPRSIGGALVDEYAKLREQLKARDREIQALKMKLATGAAAPSGHGQRPREVAGVQIWTPRFEGLDGKAHAAVVDDFRNRNKDRAFALRLRGGRRGQGACHQRRDALRSPTG